jgi:TfoX/Sxy family transcriptional regulator of competence genes
MPKFAPAPAAVVAAFEAATRGLPALEPRKMFGYPAAFLRGQMVCGVFQDRIMLRLGEADRAALLAMPGARPFEPMPGRAMREYVELPASLLRSPAKLRGWVERGVAYAATLPPKPASPRPRKKS